MPTPPELFGASKAESTLLVLYIPSADRLGQPIDQSVWVDEALKVLGVFRRRDRVPTRARRVAG